MKITYWSDYACPYCYIGEKRLETAIDELGLKEDIEIEMKAFELDPNASYEVVSRTDERFAVKYGLTLNAARERIEGISLLGRREGIDFRYADTQYTNMLDAHRLTKLVASKDNKENTNKVIHLLFDAYFTKNLKLADRTVLSDIAHQVGIEEDELNKMLDSNDYVDDVRFDENEAYKLGVHGVPYFVIDDKYVISGAQTKEGIKHTILKALDESNGSSEQGMTCGPDGCM
ncbi:DsbA family oxidoreductase [bacterium]|nr:DsbA family oxidoreductase [bacterium]